MFLKIYLFEEVLEPWPAFYDLDQSSPEQLQPFVWLWDTACTHSVVGRVLTSALASQTSATRDTVPATPPVPRPITERTWGATPAPPNKTLCSTQFFSPKCDQNKPPKVEHGLSPPTRPRGGPFFLFRHPKSGSKGFEPGFLLNLAKSHNLAQKYKRYIVAARFAWSVLVFYVFSLSRNICPISLNVRVGWLLLREWRYRALAQPKTLGRSHACFRLRGIGIEVRSSATRAEPLQRCSATRADLYRDVALQALHWNPSNQKPAQSPGRVFGFLVPERALTEIDSSWILFGALAGISGKSPGWLTEWDC